MIPRYEKKAISEIWTDENKFKTFLTVECALLNALEDANVIPKGIAKKISNSKISPKRIAEIEEQTRHDVIAFCSSITEQHDIETGKFFHFGVTSSDIIDTALSLQIKQSLEKILPAYENLLTTLKAKAQEHSSQICMGRSHGIWAEPMSFGQKLLGHYAEFERRYNDLKLFKETELTGQFSGAVGNYTLLTPEIEEAAINHLGLKVEPVSTQIIPRDRIAKMISILSLFGCALERFCIEIRHLQHSDIGEVFEGFSKGQKGSSTMPHKKNPISTENLTGMARVLRSHLSLAMDNTLLWHERDISHSSAERLYLPDALGLTLYSVERLTSTIENLVIDEVNMQRKVEHNFKYLSSYVLHQLIAKTNNTREDLYSWVQRASFDATDQAEFYAIIRAEIRSKQGHQKLDLELIDELEKLSPADIFAQKTETIFRRFK